MTIFFPVSNTRGRKSFNASPERFFLPVSPMAWPVPRVMDFRRGPVENAPSPRDQPRACEGLMRAWAPVSMAAVTHSPLEKVGEHYFGGKF